MQDYTTMKWNLKACRAQTGFTQKEVAKMAGCAEKSVVDWETGKSSPSTDRGIKLSEIYGIPMAHIDFSKEGNTPLTELERKTIIARALDPDEVSIPQF